MRERKGHATQALGEPLKLRPVWDGAVSVTLSYYSDPSTRTLASVRGRVLWHIT